MIDFIKDAENYIEKKDFASAKRSYALARRDNPSDWRAWFGLARVLTNDFSVFADANWRKFVNRAALLADEPGRGFINRQLNRYYQSIDQNLHGHGAIDRMGKIYEPQSLPDFKPVEQPSRKDWPESRDRAFGLIMIILAVLVISAIVFLAIWRA